jgi:hypothetical protein
MAINHEASTSIDQVTRRSHGAIYKNVCTVAEFGIGNGQLRTAPLGDLLWAAQIIRYGSEDAGGQEGEEIGPLDVIEYALGHAISGLDGSGPKSMPALFGLTDATRGLGLTPRREAAVEDGELGIKPESFRIHREKSLLTEVARILCHLADERILKDREARLELREADLDTKTTGGQKATFADGDVADEFQTLLNSVRAAPPKVDADLVQTTPTTVVRQVEPEEPETIGEAAHMIRDLLFNIYQLIMGQFDPGRYRRYVAQEPQWRRGKYREVPPKPMRTRLEYAVAISLLLVTLFLFSSALIGIFVTLRFSARLIFGF